MIEYIKRLHSYLMQDRDGTVYGEEYPSNSEITDKINEVVDYLNSMIGVGIFPLPDNYEKED